VTTEMIQQLGLDVDQNDDNNDLKGIFGINQFTIKNGFKLS